MYLIWRGGKCGVIADNGTTVVDIVYDDPREMTENDPYFTNQKRKVAELEDSSEEMALQN